MLTFGILLIIAVLQVLTMIFLSFSASPFFDLIPYVIVFSSVISSCWFYVAGEELYKRLPADRQFDLQRYRWFVIIPALATIAVTVAPGSIGETADIDLSRPIQLIGLAMGIANDVTLAKALVAVETKKKVTFGEVVGDFFLLLFFFIGVWWIQPRMTNLIDNETTIDPDAPLDHHLSQ